ncbi:hypothetical protein GUITHDRAFT_118914 [Guillardia theta CCMP2712]|uniref:Uncharacterized protein n=1 Tax=Guillardia theta (strain CCMP2712) TaxID=905079 RepID=L1IG37_GUITC|nr:hypothetical protein GUITHDRAFT_118914 [Guillardia theta CCMP2712]EKX34874.1 hypothetical protein GUITHDRAFT_118914 [Guillardia theta CCMP2712]|eukprot:XP_005821854.1 hypothetical protein GUITHDRAFT_118914 [Guillardia theta CCMP2712]
MSGSAQVASSVDLRARWGAFESAWGKHRDMAGLFSRGGLPSNTASKLNREGVAASCTPAVQVLEPESPFALYGVTIKACGERRPSLQVAGRASSVLKTNSFVSGSLLEQDAADVMGSYGELGKAWRYASRAIQAQSPEASVVLSFCCDKAATVGTSTRFASVQVHKGVWSIPEGCEQGSLRVRRSTVSLDGTVLAETVNVSMRKHPEMPISSVTLTTTMLAPDAPSAVLSHAANPRLQQAVREETPVQCHLVLGLPQPIACYGVPGDIVEGAPGCPVQQGIAGLVGLKTQCRLSGQGFGQGPAEGILTLLNRELGNVSSTFGICNEDQLKAAVFNGSGMDVVVVSSLTCLPV